VFQLIGSVLGGLAILGNQLWLLFFGCFSIGLGQGLGQFYRFSAVEVSPDYLKSRAVTYVLSGGIIAAFLGPTCANYSATLLKQDYLASFSLIAGIAVLNQFTVLCVNFPPPIIPKQIVRADTPNTMVANALHEGSQTNSITQSDVSKGGSGPVRMVNVVDNRESFSSQKIRSAKEIVSQPMFIVACTVATLAHTIMVMIMSNVTLAMDGSGFSFGKSSLTLEVHFLAMFCPGFFTGRLIERYGTFTVAFLGAVVFALSSFVLAVGDEFWNYSFGMVLSGLGWNFAFSAGTVMLTCCYKVGAVICLAMALR
jgi:MFS family permease